MKAQITTVPFTPHGLRNLAVIADPVNTHRIVLDLSEGVDGSDLKHPSRFRIDHDGIHIHGANVTTPSGDAALSLGPPVDASIEITAGETYAFMWTAIPMKSLPRKPNEKRGKRVLITDPAEAAAWFERRLTQSRPERRSDYTTSGATLAPAATDIEVAEVATYVIGSVLSKRSWHVTRFIGTLVVADETSMVNAVELGISQGSAHGIGVPTLAHLDN
jgi:hypothetical protein